MLILRSLMISFAVTAVTSITASAQVVPDSLLSRRVRVFLTPVQTTAQGPRTAQLLSGTLSKVTRDSITLILHPQAAPVTVATTGIDQIDLSRGVSRRRTALRVGLRGALLWGAINLRDEELSPFLWAAGGFVVGGILGAVMPEEYWQPVFLRQ